MNIVAFGSVLDAQTRQLTSFSELKESLFRGERVRVVIHYADCVYLSRSDNPEKPPEAVTGMDIDTYEHFAAGTIPNTQEFLVFSQSKLISNPKGKGFVINYGKVRVYADHSVLITAQYLDPKRHRILMNDQFKGVIHNGSNQGGIWFFTSNEKR